MKIFLELCDGISSISEIVTLISKRFTLSSEKEIANTINSLMDDLLGNNILSISSFPMPSEEIVFKKSGTLNAVYIELTNKCNLRCIHCYNSSGNARGYELSTNEMLKLIDELDLMGVTDIILTGGEPFERKDILSIISELVFKNIRFSMFSNGLLITPEIAKQLAKYHVQFVAVSVDGATSKSHERIRGKNTFSRTLKGISILQENGVNVRVNHTLTTENIDELPLFIDLMDKIGVTEIFYDRFDYFGRGKEGKSLVLPIEAGKFVKELLSKKSSSTSQYHASVSQSIDSECSPNLCGVGIDQCYIKSNGDMCFCPVLSDENFRIGNIKTDLIEDLWRSSAWDPVRTASVNDMELCSHCLSKENCLGGCKAKAYNLTGSFKEPDPWACAQLINLYEPI